MDAAAPDEESPLIVIWLVLTCAIYLGAAWLYRRSGHNLLCLPVLTGTLLLLGALALAGTNYPSYAEATVLLRWLTGPATIALAVPLYRQAALLRRLAWPIAVALAAGCAMSVMGTLAVGWVLDAPRDFVLSLSTKSATMPIAMQAAERAGGIPAIAAMAVVATGVLGPLMSEPLFRILRVEDPRVRSFSLGLVSHAIGVARVIQAYPDQLAFAALAMSLNGVCTALLLAAVSSLF
ncbi:MAG: LrgB family protein [Limnohabitans sp.]